MNLIEIMQQINKNQFNKDTIIGNIKSIIQQQSSQRLTIIASQLKIWILFDSKQSSISAQININVQTRTINIKYLLVSDWILKLKTQHQRIMYLRIILKLLQNRGFLNVKYNPVTGFIFIQSLYFLQSLDHNFQTIYYQINQKLVLENILIDLKSINFFTQPNELIINRFCQNLPQIKSYINCSNYYTWFALKNSTKNVKRSESFIVYGESKKQFNLMEKAVRENLFIQALSEVYYKTAEIKSVILLNQQEDNFLLKKYLQRSLLISKNQNQITVINVSQQVLQNICYQIDVKINCYEIKGGIYVRIQKSKPISFRFYQNLIFQSLPNKEFLNLVKYYKIKDNQIFNQNWQITNLYHSLPLNKYLEANKTTISIFTKTSLLNQISNALKFFRDLNSVYHNLLPKNLYIKKGLMMKLTDLSNVYKYNLNNMCHSAKARKQIPFTKFPHVFNLRNNSQSSIDDQRSDIYSYGILLYEILLNKSYLNVKQSKIKNLNDLQRIKILESARISIKQQLNKFNDDLLTLFIYFSLKCSSSDIEFGQNDINQFEDDQNYQYNDQSQNIDYQFKLQERPYLDWVVIITKDFYNCYQKYLV